MVYEDREDDVLTPPWNMSPCCVTACLISVLLWCVIICVVVAIVRLAGG